MNTQPTQVQIQVQPADEWLVQPSEASVPGRVRPLPGALVVLRKGDTGSVVFLSPPEARRMALSLFNLAEAAEQRELQEEAKVQKLVVPSS